MRKRNIPEIVDGGRGRRDAQSLPDAISVGAGDKEVGGVLSVMASSTHTPKMDIVCVHGCTLIRETVIQSCISIIQTHPNTFETDLNKPDDFYLNQSKFMIFLTYFIK